jgi:predicted nuclease of predicted toxin-antitoxin system
LKLLLDECVPDKLAQQLKTLLTRSIAWHYVRDDATLRGVKDPALIKYATSHDMIVVTVESSMNERSYAICTHAGIIVICVRQQHEAVRAEVFKKFLLSGYRKHVRHAVTYLTHDRMVVRDRDGEHTFHLD